MLQIQDNMNFGNINLAVKWNVMWIYILIHVLWFKSSEFDESKEFIISSLQKSKSKWKICSWHFPYKDYILGFRIPGIDMSSPNMLELYQTCRENGAFLIITSHDHCKNII